MAKADPVKALYLGLRQRKIEALKAEIAALEGEVAAASRPAGAKPPRHNVDGAAKVAK